MKRNKSGISLIVLVITIIVMVILAAAIIISLDNADVINKANDAVGKTNLKRVEQIASLAWAEAYADGKRSESDLKAAVDKALTDNKVDKNKYDIQVTDKWVQVTEKEDKVIWTQTRHTVTNGTITLTVGDYIDYKSNVTGYNDTNGWRVLGAENGELLILSSENVLDNFNLDVGTLITGQAAYAGAAVEKLQTIVKDYGNGDKATGVRSIKGEDIDRIVEYDLNSYTGEDYCKIIGKDISKLTESQKEALKIMDYGRTVTFSWDGTTNKPIASTTVGNGLDAKTVTTSFDYEHNRFIWYDEIEKVWRTSTSSTTAKNIADDNDYTKVASVTNTAVFYSGKELGQTTAAYEMLIGPYWNYKSYWLASPCAWVAFEYVRWGVRYVTSGNLYSYGLCTSNGNFVTSLMGVRAVVSLESDIQLDPNGANAWTIVN